jgi:hypothetical protein
VARGPLQMDDPLQLVDYSDDLLTKYVIFANLFINMDIDPYFGYVSSWGQFVVSSASLPKSFPDLDRSIHPKDPSSVFCQFLGWTLEGSQGMGLVGIVIKHEVPYLVSPKSLMSLPSPSVDPLALQNPKGDSSLGFFSSKTNIEEL